MYYTVYETINKINGKHYRGVHITDVVEDDYLGSGMLLIKAIKKYGIENFSKKIIAVYDNPEDMFSHEKEIVDIGPQSYNLNEGGFGGWDYVHRTGANYRGGSTQGKISYAKSLGAFDPKYKGMRGEWSRRGSGFRGKKHKQSTKERIGAANSLLQKGEGNSHYGKFWITNGYESLRIYPNDFNSFVLKGFYKGRKIKRVSPSG